MAQITNLLFEETLKETRIPFKGLFNPFEISQGMYYGVSSFLMKKRSLLLDVFLNLKEAIVGLLEF